MHMQGTPLTMQVKPKYNNIIDDWCRNTGRFYSGIIILLYVYNFYLSDTPIAIFHKEYTNLINSQSNKEKAFSKAGTVVFYLFCIGIILFITGTLNI